MKTTVSKSDFRDAFQAIRPDNFSYEGLGELFDWAEEYEANSDQEMELDVIAFCVDFSEYENIEEFQIDYDAEKYETWDDVENETIVIEFGNGSAIVGAF